jgi:hypothetical protein
MMLQKKSHKKLLILVGIGLVVVIVVGIRFRHSVGLVQSAVDLVGMEPTILSIEGFAGGIFSSNPAGALTGLLTGGGLTGIAGKWVYDNVIKKKTDEFKTSLVDAKNEVTAKMQSKIDSAEGERDKVKADLEKASGTIQSKDETIGKLGQGLIDQSALQSKLTESQDLNIKLTNTVVELQKRIGELQPPNTR